jgi:hypothetical protein
MAKTTPFDTAEFLHGPKQTDLRQILKRAELQCGILIVWGASMVDLTVHHAEYRTRDSTTQSAPLSIRMLPMAAVRQTSAKSKHQLHARAKLHAQVKIRHDCYRARVVEAKLAIKSEMPAREACD